MMQFYRSRLFAPLFFLLLNLALFHPVFSGKTPIDPNPLYQTYPWKSLPVQGVTHPVSPARDYHSIDTTLSFYPIKADLKKRMMQGDIPLWTDLLFCGSTTLANHHVSPFDLFAVPLYVFPEPAAFACILILQFVLAGWFTFLFCESMGISRPGALLAGTAYMWNGYAFHWMGNVSTNGTLLWLPLILCFLRRLYSVRSARPFHGLAFAVLAQYLAGFPQYWVYNLGVAGLYGLFLLWMLIRERSRWVPFVVKSIGAVLIATALVAPFILLFSVGWQNSVRNEKTAVAIYENRNHLSPRKLITLAIPDVFGHTEDNIFSRLLLKPEPEASGSLLRRILLGEVGSVYNRAWAYVGLLPFLFAFVSLLKRTPEARFLFLLGVSPIALLLSLNFDVVHSVISSFWHGFESLDHMRTIVVYFFCFSILSGFGFDALSSAREHLLKASRCFLAVATGCFALLVAAVLLNSIFSDALVGKGLAEFQAHRAEYLTLNPTASFFEEGIRSLPEMTAHSLSILWLPFSTMALFAIVFHLYCRGKLTNALFSAAVLVLVLFDLGYHAGNDPPLYFARSSDLYPPATSIPSLKFLKEHQGPFRVLEVQQKKASLEWPVAHYSDLGRYRRRGIRYFDFDAFDFVARPDTLLYYGIASAGGYWSVYPVRFQQLWGGRTVDTLVYTRPGESVDRWKGGWIDMQGIRYLLAAPDSVSHVYPAVYQGPDLTIFENTNALPRAYVVDRWISYPDSELLDRLKSPDFDPHQTVLLEESGPPGLSDSEKLEATADIDEKNAEDLAVRVKTNKPGMLVLSDNAFPGWKATVDGKPAKIYRANYTFRAVLVPQGSHTVAFQYDPPERKRGMLFSAAGLICWLGVAVFLRQRASMVE